MKLDIAGHTCMSVSTDSRTLQPGAAFVALRGPNHDGHDHVAAAFERGAAVAVVDHPVENVTGPQLEVIDTLHWLQQRAATERGRWNGKVVGITGSAGKTTTKEAVAAVLGTVFRTGKTQGNYNNHIGVPLTLLNLSDEDQVAVVEMGMNHAGEICELCEIAKPDVGVVTNVGTAHIENFDSRDGIAQAKQELIAALPKHGTAVLNADDPRVRAMAVAHPDRVILYGLSEDAHVRATNVRYTPQGAECDVEGAGRVRIGVPGRAGVLTALAALATARVFDIPFTHLADAIDAVHPPKMRLERMEREGMVIWNDCYNSNPEAAMMMLEVLSEEPASRRIAVLGEMLELGRWSEGLHREVGLHAARCGISVLIGIRGAARHMVDAAIASGLSSGAAFFFDEPQQAGHFVKSMAQPGDALLFKGSRGTRVELALEEFLT